MKKFASIRDIENLKGKRVLVRAGLNVPIQGGRVVDDFRIRKALPTIKYLKKRGARVVLVGHIGRDPKESLKPVAEYMNRFVKVGFVPEKLGGELEGIVDNMKNGSVIMLENVRRHAGEKKNEEAFARKLASLGDIYVNDAFSVSHRKHASLVLLPKLLPSYAGLLLEDEIKHLSSARKPKHPLLVIIGGAKFETKIPLIKKFAPLADQLFIGGALANNFYEELGFNVGKSLVEHTDFHLGKLLKSEKILLPTDVEASDGKEYVVRRPGEVLRGETISDAGPETVKELSEIAGKAKMILWNGPLGNYENGYDRATVGLLKAVAKSKAISIVGGGDTLAMISKLKLEKKFTFVSTGGGAMIEFLEKGTLPGIEALKSKSP